jgi:membrane protease YdiL (CAAX protease family)
VAVLPAFLAEFAFYLVPGFERVRKAFDRMASKPVRAALLAASAVLPYLIESPRTGTFHLSSFLILLAVVLVVSFWYERMRRSVVADLLFLAFIAAVYLSKIFDQIYGHPAAHVPLGILGRLMWIRLSLMAVLSLRSIQLVRFGFVPSLAEWRVGALLYMCFLPVGGGIAYLLRFRQFHPPEMEWWKLALVLIGTFLAFLWVVALFEEFFFRGFLQSLFTHVFQSQALGLIAASLLSGLAHLTFHSFPNWRFAILGAVSGAFYGVAFLKAKSVRGSMVTHALVVTTWRVFFTG